MIRSRLIIKTAWPFLLIILVMVAGATLAACGPAAPAATPTPTKTPRPAAAVATRDARTDAGSDGCRRHAAAGADRRVHRRRSRHRDGQPCTGPTHRAAAYP